jgi:hypothetical protein
MRIEKLRLPLLEVVFFWKQGDGSPASFVTKAELMVNFAEMCEV